MSLLEDSLRKKVIVLNDIMALSEEQENLLKQEKMDSEVIDELIDRKDVLVEELTRLDDGFESLYDRIQKQLQDNKEAYRTQIAAMQKLITEITEKTVSIQAQEQRNKKLVEQYFAKERDYLRQERINSKAVYDYYRRMSGGEYTAPQFMDSKN